MRHCPTGTQSLKLLHKKMRAVKDQFVYWRLSGTPDAELCPSKERISPWGRRVFSSWSRRQVDLLGELIPKGQLASLYEAISRSPFSSSLILFSSWFQCHLKGNLPWLILCSSQYVSAFFGKYPQLFCIYYLIIYSSELWLDASSFLLDYPWGQGLSRSSSDQALGLHLLLLIRIHLYLK